MAGEAWTVRRLLEWTTPFFSRKEVDSPRLSAELLLAHVLKVPRIKLYTDYERVLSENDLAEYRSLVQRAAEHEPIAYLTGIAQEETMAVGDGSNDLPLIQWAGTGVAMGQAHADVRAGARYVTGPLAEDGLAAAIARFVL